MRILLIAITCALMGCAGTPVRPPVGEVKVSYFRLIEGKTAKQPVGTYIGLVSQERYQNGGVKLNELFESITQPIVAVLDDETADGLVQLIYQDEFYSLGRNAPPRAIKLEDLKRMDFYTRVLTVEINGIAHTVVYETLTSDKDRATFGQLANAVFLALEVSDVKATIQAEDWRHLLEEHIREQR
ncbi:MAG: hypothetical protein HY762_06150 [Planctomycetes bacterium]|nr:hypothetical protein [Planctomycetota bacterium]